MLIGLTGGIGCGKSAAMADFAALGFGVQDTDRIVREEVLVDPSVIAAAESRWGTEALIRASQDASRMIDRARVAEIVFADERERKWWEGVIHPLVGRLWRARVQARTDLDWVIEVPLLFEAQLEKGFDFVVCVGANPSVQLARAVARGMTQAQAGLRIASQLPLATKTHSAHTVLWNDGSREFLRAQVDTLARFLKSRRTDSLKRA